MFAWAEEVKADDGRAPAMVEAFRAAGHHERRVDHADRAGRRDGRRRTSHEIRQHARRSGAGRRSARRSCKASASDGGLFVPERLPVLPLTDFPDALALPAMAERLLAPFAEGDPLAAELGGDLPRGVRLSRAARASRARARPRRRRPRALSRPDRARSRISARASLAAALERVHRSRGPQGHDPRRHVRAIPAAPSPRRSTGGRGSTSSCSIREGCVSPRQAQQLACWGDNVRTFAVRGTFDDCQRMVKEAFAGSRARARRTACRRRTASTSDGCCRRWCTTPRRAWRSGSARDARRTSSCRPATSAT